MEEVKTLTKHDEEITVRVPVEVLEDGTKRVLLNDLCDAENFILKYYVPKSRIQAEIKRLENGCEECSGKYCDSCNGKMKALKELLE